MCITRILGLHKLLLLKQTELKSLVLLPCQLMKSLFGRYYITKRTRQIAAHLAIYAAFLVVKIISIDHFLLLTIISSHSMLIKSEKLEFFLKLQKFTL